jgi:PAS domain S-box-containing protein
LVFDNFEQDLTFDADSQDFDTLNICMRASPKSNASRTKSKSADPPLAEVAGRNETRSVKSPEIDRPDSRVNILLVDDRPENLLALEAILMGLGHNLVKAASGREALRHLLEQEFAVILLDVQMPDMDGYETATLIRSLDRLQHTPIIFLTAFDKSESSLFRGYSVGAVDYIFKPFSPEVMQAKVSVFIDLYCKSAEIRRQAELLRNANRELAKTNKLLGGLTSDLEQMNRELFRERDFINAVLETAGSLVVVCNREGKIERFNHWCEIISGYTFKEVQGQFMWDMLLAEDDITEVKAVFARIIAGEYPIESESRWLTSDGRSKTIAWSTTALHDDEGEVSHIIRTGIDVTERKLAEEEIRVLNERLERRVQERTAQLYEANNELKHSKERAEAANRAKDQFLAVLSHELRTPLNPVLATVQALEEDELMVDELRPWLDIIRRNVELEARLIDDLLDLTRIAQGKLQLNIDTVEVHALIHNVLEICAADIHTKRLQINQQLRAGNAFCRGDSARLHQVLWNIIKNAIKFTPSDGVITIQTENVEGWLRVVISDSGIGIEPEVLPHIFDAFEQGSERVTRIFGGLGLGLAITRTLVDLHGGSITAESGGPGQGAIFTVELENCDVQSEKNGQTDHQFSDDTIHAGCRVLIVEDNDDTARLMQMLLERRGYQVQLAGTVKAALEAAAATTFDLVISDIGLPDGSGIDLMQMLTAKGPIRGIAVSGYGMEEDIRRSREAGFTEHLTKPINFRQLEESIHRIVESKP